MAGNVLMSHGRTGCIYRMLDEILSVALAWTAVNNGYYFLCFLHVMELYGDFLVCIVEGMVETCEHSIDLM
jgi:hypothetical protein